MEVSGALLRAGMVSIVDCCWLRWADVVMVSLSVEVLVMANIGKILFIGLLLKTDRPFYPPCI